MSDTRKLKDLSRQELYDLIWSTPVAKVAADFGVSEVTVKNHTNNRRIPRPTGRYWSKIAAGIKPRMKPMPPSANEVFEIEAQRRIPKSLALPESGTPLHPLAAEMLAAMKKIKPDYKNLICLKETNFPEVTVSKVLVERVAQTFHVLLKALEPLGIEFTKFPGKHSSGYFRWGHDRLFFTIEEILTDPLAPDRRKRWWEGHGQYVFSGFLAISSNDQSWTHRDAKEWLEAKKHPLARVLSEVVSATLLHFLTLQRKRIQDAIDQKKWKEEYEKRQREWEAKEAIRIEKEKEQAHLKAIQTAAEARKSDLIKAAEWWRRSQSITEFITECERKWKEPAGALNPEQLAWLAWAWEIAIGMSPFTVGYPDPLKHGAFDPATVPFGGPYPAAQNLPTPT